MIRILLLQHPNGVAIATTPVISNADKILFYKASRICYVAGILTETFLMDCFTDIEILRSALTCKYNKDIPITQWSDTETTELLEYLLKESPDSNKYLTDIEQIIRLEW